MALLNLTEDELEGPAIPNGLWNAILEVCEQKPQKDESKQKIFWQFMLDDNEVVEVDGVSVNLNGERVFANTSIERGQGFQLMAFLRGLGVPLAEFDPDNMEGTKVVIETKQKMYQGTAQVNIEDLRRR